MYSTRSLIGSSTLPFLLRSALARIRAFSDSKCTPPLPSIFSAKCSSFLSEFHKENFEMEGAGFSPPGSQAQLQRLKLCLHPGDDYVGSLEPESLQVLVRYSLHCLTGVTFDPFTTPDLPQTCKLCVSSGNRISLLLKLVLHYTGCMMSCELSPSTGTPVLYHGADQPPIRRAYDIISHLKDVVCSNLAISIQQNSSVDQNANSYANLCH